jgi:hypothetical protein
MLVRPLFIVILKSCSFGSFPFFRGGGRLRGGRLVVSGKSLGDDSRVESAPVVLMIDMKDAGGILQYIIIIILEIGLLRRSRASLGAGTFRLSVSRPWLLPITHRRRAL